MAFILETSQHQGPLEALLELIEARKLSITQVSLAEVCDAYLAYLEKLPELPLGETAQFVLVASTLLLIKSRSLLPSLTLTEEEKESVEELERRLAQLRIIKNSAKLLRKEWGRAPFVIERRAPVRQPIFSPAEASVSTLTLAMQKLISLLPTPEKLAEVAVAPVLKLEEVVANLKQRLSSAVRTTWRDLTKNASRGDAIVHFLAILELVRSGSVSVTQQSLFADMTIETEGESSLPRYGV
ncbi:MAG: segregation and condensation protein segregation and condensation protein [Candidatus Parcubacteria bacterium]